MDRDVHQFETYIILSFELLLQIKCTMFIVILLETNWHNLSKFQLDVHLSPSIALDQ